jgi:hypothetical protein
MVQLLATVINCYITVVPILNKNILESKENIKFTYFKLFFIENVLDPAQLHVTKSSCSPG